MKKTDKSSQPLINSDGVLGLLFGGLIASTVRNRQETNNDSRGDVIDNSMGDLFGGDGPQHNYQNTESLQGMFGITQGDFNSLYQGEMQSVYQEYASALHVENYSPDDYVNHASVQGLYGSNAPLSTASPLPTAVEHASVAGYEYTAPQQVNAFTSGYENILDMGFLSGMDTFPDMGSLFGSDVPIPGAGSLWASNHSDEYGEVIDEPAATGTGSTVTTGSSQGGEAAADTTDHAEHSEENTATDNADSTDNGDNQGNEDEYMQPGSDHTNEEDAETATNGP